MRNTRQHRDRIDLQRSRPDKRNQSNCQTSRTHSERGLAPLEALAVVWMQRKAPSERSNGKRGANDKCMHRGEHKRTNWPDPNAGDAPNECQRECQPRNLHHGLASHRPVLTNETKCMVKYSDTDNGGNEIGHPKREKVELRVRLIMRSLGCLDLFLGRRVG